MTSRLESTALAEEKSETEKEKEKEKEDELANWKSQTKSRDFVQKQILLWIAEYKQPGGRETDALKVRRTLFFRVLIIKKLGGTTATCPLEAR
jgi:hypothetical protein